MTYHNRAVIAYSVVGGIVCAYALLPLFAGRSANIPLMGLGVVIALIGVWWHGWRARRPGA